MITNEEIEAATLALTFEIASRLKENADGSLDIRRLAISALHAAEKIIYNNSKCIQCKRKMAFCICDTGGELYVY